MAADGVAPPASSPPTLNPDLLAPPSAATTSTTTALDLTNEHLPTLDGVELPETLEVRSQKRGRREEQASDFRSLFLPTTPRLNLVSLSLSLSLFLSFSLLLPPQTVDLTANRLKELDDRLLALPSALFIINSYRSPCRSIAKNSPPRRSKKKTKNEKLKDLRKLSLRQNLLADASRISQLASAPEIEEIVFHDNKLTTIPDFSPFTNLRRLELSYNEIKSLAPLSRETTNPGPGKALEELYVASNKISKIEGLREFTKLQILELGSNRLRVVEVKSF